MRLSPTKSLVLLVICSLLLATLVRCEIATTTSDVYNYNNNHSTPYHRPWSTKPSGSVSVNVRDGDPTSLAISRIEISTTINAKEATVIVWKTVEGTVIQPTTTFTTVLITPSATFGTSTAAPSQTTANISSTPTSSNAPPKAQPLPFFTEKDKHIIEIFFGVFVLALMTGGIVWLCIKRRKAKERGTGLAPIVGMLSGRHSDREPAQNVESLEWTSSDADVNAYLRRTRNG